MRRIHDISAYELQEEAIAKAIVETIRADLEAAGLNGKRLRATTQSIAFSVAAIYDGSAYVEDGDDHAVPILGFAIGRMRNRLLVPTEGGSSVHEFIPGALSAEFKR
jgi:hypothetical protein